MSKKILAIGIHEGYSDHFKQDKDLELYVLDERDIYEQNHLMYEQYGIAELRFGEFQQTEAFLETAVAWHDELGFDAVVPCWEYGVRAAGLLADRLGLKFPGMRAVDACTDKIRLRNAAADTGIPQPRFAEANSVQDVKDFFDGKPIVVKPTNRRQSVGVVRIDHERDIAEAWRDCTSSHENSGLANRPLSWRFMVEEYMPGYQVSVETLVDNGQVLFDNVSLVETPDSQKYFPVMSVVVPAPIPQADYAAAVAAAHRLLDGLDAASGMFHSEWKLDEQGPRLVECAARVPGAFIPELVVRAYGFNLYGALIRTLANLDPLVIKDASSTAAIRHFSPPSGTLQEVRGIEHLAAHPSVFSHRVKVLPGQAVPSFRDSWQRAGYFALCTKDPAELYRTISVLEDSVEFVVRTD